jgi:hypothetical protein
MPFISDKSALTLGKQILSADEYAAFEHCMKMFRHFDDCVATNTPSEHCIDADPVKNLEWCRLGLKIEGDNFEHWIGEILHRTEATEESK